MTENKFNPNLQETQSQDESYEDQVNREMETEAEESARARLKRLEEALGGADAVDELIDPDGFYQRPPKQLHEISEEEIDNMDDEEVAQYSRAAMKETVRQARDDRSQYNKQFRLARRILTDEFPELVPNEQDPGGKFPFVYSHLRRVTTESPAMPFEERLRAAAERTTDYLGLRPAVNKRRMRTYTDLQRQAHDKTKRTYRNE